MLLTALCLTFIVFTLTNLAPNLEKLAKTQGNFRMTDEAVASWLENNGYAQPIVVKYGQWLGVLPGWTRSTDEGMTGALHDWRRDGRRGGTGSQFLWHPSGRLGTFNRSAKGCGQRGVRTIGQYHAPYGLGFAFDDPLGADYRRSGGHARRISDRSQPLHRLDPDDCHA